MTQVMTLTGVEKVQFLHMKLQKIMLETGLK